MISPLISISGKHNIIDNVYNQKCNLTSCIYDGIFIVDTPNVVNDARERIQMDEETLYSILLCIIIGFVILFGFGAVSIITYIKSDDDKEESKAIGKIIEKKTESHGIVYKLPVDLIVVEWENGIRSCLRNVKTKEIILAPGDAGTFTIRGETIYAFEREQ